jgi:nucleotide-binding universal stress UspA family protein
VPEVVDYQMYVGTASPYNFNGLVRHYFLRRGSNVADIQVNLLPKEERPAQSHDIAKRVREPLQKIAQKYGANVKVAEVPPGPPVLQTIVAEVYGPNYERQIEVAKSVKDILEKTDGVVDVDWYVEDNQTKYNLKINKEKAAISGISAEQIAQTLRVAVDGINVGLLHVPTEKEDVYINLRLPKAERSSLTDLQQIKVIGNQGNLVRVSELVEVQEVKSDKSIYHKNLMPVVYVTADVAGVVESPVYAILGLNDKIAEMKLPEGYELERYVASQPFMTNKYAMKWDGEWHITYEVFRDMGIAFAAVMVLIYILVVGWFQSFKTPLTIMAAIPFSLVGILPAHALMGAFFTATSMIGFIAGAGIVVRNSIILVDFVELRMQHGMSLVDAVVDAGAVRFRPMLLTAAAVIVGSAVMLADPIFQGLAISLMAGEVTSLLLSRMAVPVLFYLSERKKHAENAVKSDEKTVLCPTDFSDTAKISLKYAKVFAEALGAKLSVLYADNFEPPPYFTVNQIEEINQAAEQHKLAALNNLKSHIAETIGEGNNVRAKVEVNSPIEAILDESEKIGPELIVLGTHGRSGFDKLRFGSVVESVMRESNRPILTVHPQNSNLTKEISIKHIICPVDYSEQSRHAVRYAVKIAKLFQAQLLILNVLTDEKEKADERLYTLCDWVPEETRGECEIKEIVRRGNPIEQIAAVATEAEADLIVVGTKHRLLKDEMVAGANISEIIRLAQSPVLTVVS